MKLKKAIEVLKSPESMAIISLDPDLKDAVKLGEEALKYVKHSRLIFPDVEVGLLPGETED